MQFRKSAIDIHVHLGTPGPVPSKDELARVIRTASHYGIKRMVLVSNLTAMGGANPSMEDIATINTHTLAAMERYPDFFIGFCYLNPSHPVSFITEEIARCIVEGGMKGIKLWIAVKATDQRLDCIMDSASNLAVPVLHHAMYKQTRYSFNESTPAEVADLARRFPQVPIIMAHLTGCGCRGVLDVAELPNVLIDTSGGQPESDILEYAVRQLGSERILYGSDWPLRDFGVQLGRIYDAALSDKQRADILWRNAARLLGLEASV